MPIEALDPTYDESAVEFHPAPRPNSLTGLTVGIISNGKRGTVPFFEAFAAELRDRYDVAHVVRAVKPNYSAPASDDILDKARRWHVLVAGVGD